VYQIKRNINNIIQLQERTFSELGFRERDHLQEWIAKNPEVLGEELLIVQKEFNGFSQTNERLDLLALDKEGGVVIIENKLDDTGRDVVWQSLKYASYCSTLSTSQIIKIYRSYLDSHAAGADAKAMILDFMETEDEDTLVLNRKDQRIILVANSFRKEVTSTVLWLRDHDLQIQCFRAKPYSLGDDIFLQVEQIIPIPEVRDFIVDIREKDKEDKGKSATVAQTEADLLEFWKGVKFRMSERQINYFDNIKAQPRWYLGFSKGRGRFGMVIGRSGLRVELYFHSDEDKQLFRSMEQYTAELNQAFENKLIWQRLEGKKASRISFELPKTDLEKMGAWDDPDAVNARAEWFVTEIDRFYQKVFPFWERAQREGMSAKNVSYRLESE
jgi:hypothetical protein